MASRFQDVACRGRPSAEESQFFILMPSMDWVCANAAIQILMPSMDWVCANAAIQILPTGVHSGMGV
jgi:hypothetical protein